MAGDVPDRIFPAAHPGFLLRAAALSLAAALLAACSLDYGPGLSEEFAEDMPEMVITDFDHTVVENGRPVFTIRAGRAESYGKLGKTRLERVSFVEYSSAGDGSVVAEGRADSAVFWTETESADLYGAVSFRSARDGVTVESGNLRWDGEKRLLTSGNDTVTTLMDDDGSRLSGSGFSADAARRSFSFGRRIDGTINPGGDAGGPVP